MGFLPHNPKPSELLDDQKYYANLDEKNPNYKWYCIYPLNGQL